MLVWSNITFIIWWPNDRGHCKSRWVYGQDLKTTCIGSDSTGTMYPKLLIRRSMLQQNVLHHLLFLLTDHEGTRGGVQLNCIKINRKILLKLYKWYAGTKTLDMCGGFDQWTHFKFNKKFIWQKLDEESHRKNKM